MTRYQTEQSSTPIRRSEAAALAGVALAALILALLLLATLALAAGGSSAFQLEWLRAYLFRNAVRNTLTVMAVAATLGVLFASLTRLATRDAGYARTIVLYALLIPLATPAPLAALLWRMTLAGDGSWLQEPLPALAAIGMVSLWRVAPLLALILLAWPRCQQPWLAAGALAAYAAAADVTTPLLLTGGEPFNATHTLASWTFQLVAVNHGWRAGAAAALAWLGALALPVSGLLFALGVKSPAARPIRSRSARSRTPVAGMLAGILLLAWMLTPLVWPALNNPTWLGQMSLLLRSVPYWRGWLNILLLAGGVALVAAPVAGVAERLAVTRGKDGPGRSVHRAVGRGLLGLALLSWPAAFVGLGWLAVRTDGRAGALLWLFYSALAICLGVGVTLMISSGMALSAGGRKRNRTLTAAIGFFAIWHGFLAVLILRAPLAAQPVGSVIIADMGAPVASNSPLLAASLATSLLAWLALAFILKSYLFRYGAK